MVVLWFLYRLLRIQVQGFLFRDIRLIIIVCDGREMSDALWGGMLVREIDDWVSFASWHCSTVAALGFLSIFMFIPRGTKEG